jgi:hypothetical protein
MDPRRECFGLHGSGEVPDLKDLWAGICHGKKIEPTQMSAPMGIIGRRLPTQTRSHGADRLVGIFLLTRPHDATLLANLPGGFGCR